MAMAVVRVRGGDDGALSVTWLPGRMCAGGFPFSIRPLPSIFPTGHSISHGFDAGPVRFDDYKSAVDLR